MRKTIPGSTIASLTGIAAKRTYVHVPASGCLAQFIRSPAYRTREILLRALGKNFPEFEHVPVNKIHLLKSVIFSMQI